MENKKCELVHNQESGSVTVIVNCCGVSGRALFSKNNPPIVFSCCSNKTKKKIYEIAKNYLQELGIGFENFGIITEMPTHEDIMKAVGRECTDDIASLSGAISRHCTKDMSKCADLEEFEGQFCDKGIGYSGPSLDDIDKCANYDEDEAES